MRHPAFGYVKLTYNVVSVAVSDAPHSTAKLVAQLRSLQYVCATRGADALEACAANEKALLQLCDRADTPGENDALLELLHTSEIRAILESKP